MSKPKFIHQLMHKGKQRVTKWLVAGMFLGSKNSTFENGDNRQVIEAFGI